MSADPETLRVYDNSARDYADKFQAAEPGTHLKSFMAALGDGGTVLDLGCGPGGTAALLMAAGYTVVATDASEAMVALAQQAGVDARRARFDQLDVVAEFDGIWANFSLLHAARADMPAHLGAIHRALKPGGVFHIGLKIGTGESRDSIGRFYAYYTEPELVGLLADAGLRPFQTYHGEEAGLSGDIAPWIILHARKDT